MIGKRLKNIAESYSMTVEKGYAWGQIDRYIFVLDEGVGYIGVTINISVASDDDRRDSISGFISNNYNKYNVKSCILNHSSIVVQIKDIVNAKKYVISFIDDILQKLKDLDVPGADVCVVCREDNGDMLHNVKIDTGIAKMHQKCFDEVKKITDDKQKEFHQEEKNHFIGTIGALIGGIIGTIPWVIVYMLGFFVGWLGFIIGIAANKGYELFRGKNSRAKPFIIIIIVIICVLLAQVTCEIITLNDYLKSEGINDVGVFDMLRGLGEIFANEAGYRESVILNVLLGLLFAGLGTFSMIKKMLKQRKGNVSKIEMLDKYNY